MADHSERITTIQTILRAGAVTVTVDGVTVHYDFAQLRRELRQLISEDDAQAGRRPLVSRFRLDTAFE